VVFRKPCCSENKFKLAGFKRSQCWCYQELKDGDTQCVREDCWETTEHFFGQYRKERREWHADCECQIDPPSFFHSTRNLHDFHASIFKCGQVVHAPLDGEALWNKEYMFGECKSECVEKWASRFAKNAVENSGAAMVWK
jgi:hypothetical protein